MINALKLNRVCLLKPRRELLQPWTWHASSATWPITHGYPIPPAAQANSHSLGLAWATFALVMSRITFGAAGSAAIGASAYKAFRWAWSQVGPRPRLVFFPFAPSGVDPLPPFRSSRTSRVRTRSTASCTASMSRALASYGMPRCTSPLHCTCRPLHASDSGFLTPGDGGDGPGGPQAPGTVPRHRRALRDPLH